MTALTGIDPPDTLAELLRGGPGRLLREELDRRWPPTADGLTAISRYALLPPGKLLRPIMTMTCAQAVGGDPAEVLAAALAMEYLHVATLVHDDIIDGDEVRRFRPSVHAAHGVPDAILTGDHLIFVAFQAITEHRPERVPWHSVVAAASALAVTGADLCRGQALEARLAGDPTVAVADYLTVARLKTGALFRAACRVGALLGGAGPERAAALGCYGESLGVAFQIRDDLLALTRPAEVTGKPAGSDLANGRPTLPVLLAHRAGTADTRERLAAALAGRDATTLAEFSELLASTGALAEARRCAAEHGTEALARLAEAAGEPGAEALAAIVRWTVGT